MDRVSEADSLRDPLSPREALRAERLARIVRERRLPNWPKREPLVECAHRARNFSMDVQQKRTA